jgi:replicative DNA helicase
MDDDRLPPQDIDAEKSVLGSVLVDPTCLDALAFLKPEDFYADAHQRLYRHLSAMYDEGRKVDPVMVIDRLRSAGDLEAIGGPAYIAEVAATVPYASNAAHYAKIVKNRATRRRMIDALEVARGELYSDIGCDPDKVADAVQQQLTEAATGGTDGKPIHVSAATLDFLDHVDRIMEGSEQAGMMTGLPHFDEQIGGLFARELALVAACTGFGKTAFGCQVAYHFASHGRGVAYFSLEMAARELAQRILCSEANVSSRLIRTNTLKATDRERLVSASQPTTELPLWFNAQFNLTTQEIHRWVKWLQRERDIKLVVVDYIQRLTPTAPRGSTREREVASLSDGLKRLSVDTNTAVLALCQLNREADKERFPATRHLKESGALEQDADLVAFLWKYDWDKTESATEEAEAESLKEGHQDHPYSRMLYVRKSRNGEVGDFPLSWVPARTKFYRRGDYQPEYTPHQQGPPPGAHEEFTPYAQERMDF